MLRDQHRLRGMARKSKRDLSSDWQTRLRESIGIREARKIALPAPRLDDELPVAQRADEIRRAINEHQVVVISGETGSGKSTQLPLVCLQLGLATGGFIGHTQPRRIAARSVAARLAQQLTTKLGDQVGYKIRFHDQTNPQSFVKVMTDGILLAETAADRFLNQYEVIIVDEAHERSLNVDFLLGYLKRLLPKRPELKLIITSATIDTQKFADHFTLDSTRPVPVFNVEGRNYPVDILYRPPGYDVEGQPIDQDLEQATIDSVLELAARDRGDMLIFLPTEHDIRTLAKKLRSQRLPRDGNANTEILPLYARLSTEQQSLIFERSKARKIVLATNVAESSITVPGIRYVIDTGTARISRYAPRSKVQRLPIESVSQASANQRAGRCGRVAPGVCVRLYSEDDFAARPKFTTPEIRRTNLASVILQTKALKLGPIEEFPFIEPPRTESIRDGYRTLHEIGAVDDTHELTRLGRGLSRLPVDPRIGRMLFAASENGCLAELLVIASALEIQDPRVRPAEKQAAADEQHAKFAHEDSDFFGILQLWEFVHAQREKLSRSQFRKACQQNFLSLMLLQQWMDVHRQLKSLARENKLRMSTDRDNYESIHQAILTGMLSGVAMQSDRREYTGGGGVKFNIWPGSGTVKKPPKWILVAEIVETAKRYGRNVARIDPSWIEPLAGHLVKRNYSEPHWSKKRQSATAYERVSLFGLPIVARRPVRYGPIDPDLSRQLLIDQGLSEDQMRVAPPFLIHNRQVIEELEQNVAKTRNRDWIVDRVRVRNFYDRNLPTDAIDGASLSSELKKNPQLDDQLRITAGDLIPESVDVSPYDFPNSVPIGDLQLPVHYKFTPGDEDDGVSLQVPLEGVAQIHDNHLGWLVPGLLEARITALIRSLPKSIRRLLVPAPDTAREVAGQLSFGQGSFWCVVADKLSQLAGQPVTPDMFDLNKMDEFLKFNVQVCDEAGQVIAQSRKLSRLKSQLSQQLSEAPVDRVVAVAERQEWHQDGMTDWSWGDLPEQIIVRRGIADVPLFPTIFDASDSVGLRLYDNRALSDRVTRRGLTTLFRIANRKAIRGQVNWLPELEKLSVIAMPLFESDMIDSQGQHAFESKKPQTSSEIFKHHVAMLMTRMAFVEGRAVVRSRNEFDERNQNAAERIGLAAQKIAPWLSKTLSGFQECRLALEKLSDRFEQARIDIHGQFDHLFPSGFLIQTPWCWLEHYPRYLQAIVLRLDQLCSGGEDRDRRNTTEIQSFWERFLTENASLIQQSSVNDQLDYFGWMIEEYRVSLFAQQLGTSETVSAKRLEKQWSKVGIQK